MTRRFRIGGLIAVAVLLGAMIPSPIYAAGSVAQARRASVGMASFATASSRRVQPDPDSTQEPAVLPDPAPAESATAKHLSRTPTLQQATPTVTATTSTAAVLAFRNSSLKNFLPSGAARVVDEPSVSNDGDAVFFTGNHFAALSLDSGLTFSYVSPYTTFPASDGGFCCDQSTIYDPSADITVWVLMYYHNTSGNNIQRLAVSHGRARLAAGSWHYWDFSAQTLGLPSGDFLDYPQLSLGSNFLYLTSNAYNSFTGSYVTPTLLRFPLSVLAIGGTLSFDYYQPPVVHTVTPVSGATTTMYFASHLTTSSLRIFSWPEGSTSVTWSDVGHSTYVSMASGAGTCPSPDGFDMCRRDDSRVKTGWLSAGILGFMWDARQGTGGLGSFPYPYVHVVRISISPVSLIDQPIIWSSTTAYVYPNVAVDGVGNLGLTVAFGGGSYFPSSAVAVQDDLSPGAWQFVLTRTGTNGPSANVWGDYLTSRPASGGGNTWLAATYTLQSGSTASAIEPRLVWFGRQRDDPFAPGGGLGAAINATAGVPTGTLQVASFTGPSGAAADYTASVDWGDGSSASSGNITSAGSAGATIFAVTSGHTYSTAGSYIVTVTDADQFGSEISIAGSAAVS